MQSSSGYSQQHLRRVAHAHAQHGLPSDPPAILTDRTTYLNFLETQLDRVSAACMNVAQYDQRFKDMEALIVKLEGRCSSITKLATINQETILNVKGDIEKKLDKLNTRITTDTEHFINRFDSMA